MSNSRLAVVILAAGQGTRMRSSLPKVLHPLAGMPLIGHVLDTAMSLDPKCIITVLKHEREQVESAVLAHHANTIIVEQDDIPGTGRALEIAVEALPKDFQGDILVLSGDVPLIENATILDLIAHHDHNNNHLSLLSAIVEDASGFGRIIRNNDGAFVEIIEHKDANDQQLSISEINSGIYIFEQDALKKALQKIDSNNNQNEKYLTDAAAKIIADNGRASAIAVNDVWQVAGINDRVQLAAVAKELNSRIIKYWQYAGVSVQDPETTWIDRSVSIGQDTLILPGTQILGASTIAPGAIIGPDTTLLDCEVGSYAQIRRSDAQLAVIAENTVIGPFSYLRPGTVTGKNAKIGAYVESKNATLGDGTKVPHLSYIGDVTIGADSNIGAGTIVANYDGVNKHKTVIGNNVRVGSKNVLVAPVTIHDGAYTAGGAVIRKDVPAGALGINPLAQRNIDGWVKANRGGSPSAAASENGD